MMSGQVITELFQQIVHSEERIKQRFEDLKKGTEKLQTLFDFYFIVFFL